GDGHRHCCRRHLHFIARDWRQPIASRVGRNDREVLMADRKDERSLGELLAELSRETGQLVRKEVELATTEMTAKARKAGSDAAMMAAGGALAHAGLLVILAAFVIGLAQLGVTPWVSALIVGVVTILIGYVLV